MQFLYPLFLLGALAIAIPIAVHLFRRRTEAVVEFPAVRLLEKAPVEQQRRRRLRELILLALRVSALVLLAFAFARPYVADSVGALPAPVTVVALDTSLSLSAPTQFDAARQAARRAVENAPATHTVSLITFADAATVVVPPTPDRGSVAAAIDAAAPGAGGTRYRTALARAAETIGGASGRIVVVTDLQQVGWEAADEGAVPEGIGVEVIEVAPPAGNVAISAARRDGDALVAALHNFGTRAARLPVRLLIDGREATTRTVEVAPQAAVDVRFAAALPPRGAAEVRVEDVDGYQGDNARFVVLDPPRPVPLFVITAEPPRSSRAGFYIEKALAVADDAFATRVIDGRAFSALPADQFGDPAGLIVLGTSTLDRSGRERIAAYLRGGGRVLVSLGPDTDLETLADTVGTQVGVAAGGAAAAHTVTLIAVDGRHPIFRPFLSPTGALGDVYIEEFRRLQDQEGRTVLARFSGAGSAMTEETVGSGRLLLFASDLDNRWNRFPLNPAFVPWAVETARYLTQGRESRQAWTLPAVPAGVPHEPGIHDVHLTGTAGDPQARTRVAVNSDVRESNPARITTDEFTGAITRMKEVEAVRQQAAAREQEEEQRLWQWGLLVMFVALASEGFIGRRAT